MLHEYLHSLGMLDVEATRSKTYQISAACLVVGYPAMQLSVDVERFFPNLVYPVYGWRPQHAAPVAMVRGFDLSSRRPYIA